MKNVFTRIFIILASIAVINNANAESNNNPEILGDDFISVDQLLAHAPDDTKCATAAFERGLQQTLRDVAPDTDQVTIESLIHQAFSRPDVLTDVLACPEIINVADDDTITFLPVKYTFPDGREIVVNYETQPKILRQRLTLAGKRALPSADPNPRIGDDGAEWSNTDPAWYGIMVVQHGALDNFVGPDKNNTVSLKYIEDNVNALFPQNRACTRNSALATTNNPSMINQAMHIATQDTDKKDTNAYYVAGDVNLQWISYAEIGLDVAITVATMGGGAVFAGITKSARASRTLKNLGTTIRTLSKSENVTKYMRTQARAAKLAKEVKTANGAQKTKLTKELSEINKTMREMERADPDVKKYKNATKSFAEINKWRRNVRALRMPQRGNIIVRAWRAARAANTGAKTINRGARVARASTMSGRVRDWLFHSTMRNAGKLAKMEEAGGLVYAAIKFGGNMYDWSETSTGNFTHDIQFKPLLLLSADDLDGQENVVNHGMWLMWMGDSTNAADDDAAFLQVMDAADKFHQDLTELQDEKNEYPCAVDIYIVRPVIRNPGAADAQLYYLIMNDEPWTTVDRQ